MFILLGLAGMVLGGVAGMGADEDQAGPNACRSSTSVKSHLDARQAAINILDDLQIVHSDIPGLCSGRRSGITAVIRGRSGRRAAHARRVCDEVRG